MRHPAATPSTGTAWQQMGCRPEFPGLQPSRACYLVRRLVALVALRFSLVLLVVADVLAGIL